MAVQTLSNIIKTLSNVIKTLSNGCNSGLGRYRLVPKVYFPEQIHDIARATKYFLQPEVLQKYMVDPGRIGISGDSAGGNLAAALGQQVTPLSCGGAAMMPGGCDNGVVRSGLPLLPHPCEDLRSRSLRGGCEPGSQVVEGSVVSDLLKTLAAVSGGGGGRAPCPSGEMPGLQAYLPLLWSQLLSLHSCC